MLRSRIARTVVAALAAVTVVAALVAVAPPASAAPAAGGYVALTPARILDTRIGYGAPLRPVNPGEALPLQVSGRGGVPASGVAAVVLNVTVTGPTAAGWIAAYPDGVTYPGVSNLNFNPGLTTANRVVVQLGAGGRVDLGNGSGGTVQLIADVSGYFLAGAPSAPGMFGSLSPARLLDTRSGLGAPVGEIAPGGTVALQVTGRGAVPVTGVSAVALNVTATEPTAAGWAAAYPDGMDWPGVSNLNFLPGQTIPNLVVVPVGANGKVSLRNGSGGTLHLVADVSGYFLAGAPVNAGALGALSPQRVLDTRDGTGIGAPTPVGPYGTVALNLAGKAGVPASGVSAVVLNVTVTQPSASGWIAAYAHGRLYPGSSNLNFAAGQTIPNLVIAPVSPDGTVDLLNGSAGTVQLIADVFGYIRSADQSAPTPGTTLSLLLRGLRAGEYATIVVATASGTGAVTIGTFGPADANGALNVTLTLPSLAAGSYILAIAGSMGTEQTLAFTVSASALVSLGSISSTSTSVSISSSWSASVSNAVTIAAAGLKPGEMVSLTVSSSPPQSLGTFGPADSAGALLAGLTMPPLAAGNYTLTLTGSLGSSQTIAFGIS
ncbi:MAG: hypothetical protein LBQ06_00765 [Frankiaceae bacterium]|jgi:hypothetical protein|nr:hypothetical protein [Frankiaceae bacterium]